MELDKPRKSKMRHLRLLLYLIPILAIVIGYGGIILATGESYPFTIVLGHSMTPTILPGSVALIDKVPFNSLQVGDIIVFVPQIALMESCDNAPVNSLNSESSIPCFVIHRIVNIFEYQNGTRIITTKGDDNPQSIPLIDTDINSSMYIGKVVLQIPEAGYVTTSPTNEIIAVIILIALAAQLLFERSQSKKTVAAPTTSAPI
jgi:signal peptidase I